MNSRASASASLTWSLILVQSSIADHLLVGPQPIQPGTEDVHDGQQVVHQLVFRRERVAVHDQQVRAVPPTEGCEPLEAESYQPVLVGDDEPPHLPQLDLLHEPIVVPALIFEPTANLFNPLVRLIAVPSTALAYSSYLSRQFRLL